jgi:hypothetical protein
MFVLLHHVGSVSAENEVAFAVNSRIMLYYIEKQVLDRFPNSAKVRSISSQLTDFVSIKLARV